MPGSFYNKSISDEVLVNAVERVTDGLSCITTDHAYIHEGGFFEAAHRFTLASTAVGLIYFKTPAVKYVHYRNEKVSSSGDKVTIELFEGTEITAETGTDVTPRNHNRLSSTVSGMVMKHTPTVTAEGTNLATAYLGGGTGTGQTRSGDVLTEQSEWVLKRDHAYLIKVTNSSAATNIIQVNPVWYEEAGA